MVWKTKMQLSGANFLNWNSIRATFHFAALCHCILLFCFFIVKIILLLLVPKTITLWAEEIGTWRCSLTTDLCCPSASIALSHWLPFWQSVLLYNKTLHIYLGHIATHRVCLTFLCAVVQFSSLVICATARRIRCIWSYLIVYFCLVFIFIHHLTTVQLLLSTVSPVRDQ